MKFQIQGIIDNKWVVLSSTHSFDDALFLCKLYKDTYKEIRVVRVLTVFYD